MFKTLNLLFGFNNIEAMNSFFLKASCWQCLNWTSALLASKKKPAGKKSPAKKATKK